MSATYVLTLVQENEIKKKIYVSLTEDSPEAIQTLSTRTDALYRLTQKGRALWIYDLETLKERVKELKRDDQLDHQLSIGCHKLEFPIAKIPAQRTFLQIWKEMTVQWPVYIPIINLFWALFVTPFLSFFQFLNESNRVKDEGYQLFLEKQNRQNYPSFLRALQDFHTRSCYLDSLTHWSFFRSHLSDAVKKGMQLHEGLKQNQENLVQNLAKEIEEALNQEQAFSIPFGFEKDGVFIPLFVTFSKACENTLRLEVNSWGDHQFSHLQKCYEIKFQGPPQEIIEKILRRFCVVLPKGENEESVKTSLWQHIQQNSLEVVDCLSHREDVPEESFSDQEKWLHNNLYLMKLVPFPSSEGSIQDFFEVPLEARLECTLLFLYEQCTHLESVFDQLSAKEKVNADFAMKSKLQEIEEQLAYLLICEEDIEKLTEIAVQELSDEESSDEALEDFIETKKMELIQERITEFKKANPQTQSCFDLVEKLKDRFQKTLEVDKEKRQRMDKKATSHVQVRPFQTKIPQDVLEGMQPTKKGEKTPRISVTNAYLDLLQPLQNFRSETTQESYFRAHSHLEKARKEAENLIEKKEYNQARSLIYEVMCLMPAPLSWGVLTGDPASINSFSETLAGLSQHIWECSLRMRKKALEPSYLIQMIKMQCSILSLIRITGEKRGGIDREEIFNFFYIHPHYRFGVYPKDDEQVMELVDFLELETKSRRLDVYIQNNSSERSDFSKETFKTFVVIQRNPGKSQALPDQFIDLKRSQLFLSSLVKPSASLCKFYSPGIFGRVRGLHWLDSMHSQAIREGYKGEEDVKRRVQEIKLIQVEEELNKMERLEIDVKKFVTDYPTLIIVDRDRPTLSGVAYMPNGYGLPYHLEKKYGQNPNEQNTEIFTGRARSVGAFVGSDSFSINWSPPRINETHIELLKGTINRMALSEQKRTVEGAYLARNLQRKPKDGISQISAFGLDTIEYAGGRAFEDRQIIHKESIIHALTMGQGDPNLLYTSSTRKKIELVLYRPFALQQIIRFNPSFFIEFFRKANQELREKWEDDRFKVFYIQLADAVKVHTQLIMNVINHEGRDPYEKRCLPPPSNLKGHFQELLDMVPSLDCIRTVEEETHTLFAWLLKEIEDPKKNRAALANCLLRYSRRQELDQREDSETLAGVIFAASIFLQTANQVMQLQFNQETDRWLTEKFYPYLQQVLANDEKRVSVLTYVTRLIIGDSTIVTPNWECEQAGVYISGNYRFNVNTLALTDKNGSKAFKIEVLLPDEIRTDLSFMTLFDKDLTQATIKQGEDVGTFIYSFTYKEEKYRIIYNQPQSSIKIFKKFSNGLDGERYFLWINPKELSDFADEKEPAALDKLIKKQGLWLDEKEQKRAYVMQYHPREKFFGECFYLKIDKEGKVQQAIDSSSELTVILSKGDFFQLLPCQSSSDILLLGSQNFLGRGTISEILFLNDGTRMKRSSNNTWKIHHRQMGSQYEWLRGKGGKYGLDKLIKTLGPIGNQIALPMIGDKDERLLLYPYLVKRSTISDGTIEIVQNYDLRNTSVPLTISFDFRGRMKASPSACLYLAYFFAMKRDYMRARVFLERAQKAPRISQEEFFNLEQISQLFSQFPEHSLKDNAFALRGALVLLNIRSRHFNRSFYDPKFSSVYYQGVQEITDMYERYTENLEKARATGEILSQEQREDLTKEENLEIQRLCKTSLREFVHKYLEVHSEDLSKRKQILEVEESYLEIGIDTATLRSPSREFIHRILILAKDINNPKNFREICNPFYLDVNTILTRLFPLYRYIYHLNLESEEDKRDFDHIVACLSLPVSRSHKKKNSQEKRDEQYAQMCRQYLLAACYNKKKGQELIFPFSFEEFQALRKELPLLPRAYPPFSLMVGVFEQFVGPTSMKIKRSMDEISSFLQSLAIRVPGSGFFHEIYEKQAVFQEKEEKPSLSIEKIRENQMTSLEAIQALLEDQLEALQEGQDSIFLKLELQMLIRMIKEEESDKNKLQKTLSLINASEARGYSVLDMRKLAEDMREIQRLEREPDPSEPSIFTYPQFNREIIDSTFVALREKIVPFCTLQDEELTEKTKQVEDLENRKRKAQQYFQPNEQLSEAEKEENGQLSKGLEASFTEISEEILQKTKFTPDEIRNLKEFVNGQMTHKEGIFQICRQKEGELLGEIEKDFNTSPYQMPSSLRDIYKVRECYSQQDILDAFFNLFSTSQGTIYLQNKKGLFQKGLEYMLLKRTQNQFEIAQDLLKDDSPSPDKVVKARDLLQAAINGEIHFINNAPYLAFRCLITECKSSIVLRKKQIEVLEKINERPNRWDSLRMGIGKTSYLMPIIADLLVHKGFLPILTVPSQLFNSNRDQFDRTTRELFSRGAFEFRMPIVEEVSVAYLSEKYLELLKVKQRGSYVITDTQQLALLNEEIIQIKDLLSEEEEGIVVLFARLRLHYLQKIAFLLYGQGKIKSHFYGDEVDDTHHISKQINRARGEKAPLEPIIIQANQVFFGIIMRSEEDSELFPLKKALMESTQMTWKPEEIQKAMRAVSKELLQDPLFLDFLGKHRETVKGLDAEEWARYLLKEREELPKGLSGYSDERYQKMIGAMKTVIGENAIRFFALQTGNSFGFSDYIGPQIVPKSLRIETEGMRYGDVFELVHSQFLGYIQCINCQGTQSGTKEFFIAAIERLKNKNPTRYQALNNRAKDFYLNHPMPKEPLYEYLMQESSWDFRLQILDSVLSDGYIDRYKEQIEMNVQDLFHGASYGGVTGTLDPYLLPFISEETLFSRNIISTRAVESETLLRICMNQKDGLDTEVGVFAREKVTEYINGLLRKEETSAIINNSGVGIEGIDNLIWTSRLRGNVQRSFLFTHPKTGTPYLWKVGEQNPATYLQQPLPEDTVCLFAPFDTRGTDRPISRGDVHLFLGPATTLQELMQAIYRARKLGGEHRLHIHIDEAFASQVANQGDLKTYGDVINYIKKKTLDQNLSLNLRTQTRHIFGEIKATFMQFLREPNTELDNPDFWREENLKVVKEYLFYEKVIFQNIRSLFIKQKEIDFELIYSPDQMGSGHDVIEQTFEKGIAEAEKYFELVKLFSEKLENRSIDNKRSKVEESLQRALPQKLKDLCDRLHEMKKRYLENKDNHAKFLPGQTVLNASVESGTHEQVLELQSTQTQEVETQKAPEKETLTSVEKEPYRSLNIASLDNPLGGSEAFSLIEDPFSNLLISPSAKQVYNNLPRLGGDPLFYMVISKNGSKLGLVTRTDIHREIVGLTIKREEITRIREVSYNVFSPQKQDSLQVFFQSDRALYLFDNQRLNLAKARLYMGFTEFLEKDIGLLRNWAKKVEPALKNWAQQKGTQAVLDFVNTTLLEKA